MALPIQGFGGVVAEVDSTFRAHRISARPPEMLGAYRTSNVTGSIAATLGAASSLYSMRWTDASKLFVLDYVKAEAANITAITTGVFFNLELSVARAFTVSDSGGTAITLSGNNQKMRTSHATSVVGDLRIASTTNLTVGTRTVDANPIGQIRGFTSTTVNTPFFGAPGIGAATTGGYGFTAADMEAGFLYKRQLDGLYPVVLAQNEGLLVRNVIAGPATGTFGVHVSMGWFEVATF